MKLLLSALVAALVCVSCIATNPSRRGSWTVSSEAPPNKALMKKRLSGKRAVSSSSKIAARQDGAPQDPCKYLYDQQLADSSTLFTAHQVYQCLVSIPFYAAQATQLLKYIKDTFRFQTSLAYLRDPPPSYQQPSVDVMQTVDFIQDQVDTGSFTNQYAFESAVQRLLARMHDGHVLLLGGVLEVTSFGSPKTVTALSSDGVELPKVYLTDDLYNSMAPGAEYQPSAVLNINGQSAADYLERFAQLNAYGNLDPFADWNDLQDSQVNDALGTGSYFGVLSSFYNDDFISFEFENGSSTSVLEMQAFLDLTSYCTNPIANGADVYNCLVMPPPPQPTDSSSSVPPTVTSTVLGSSTVTDIGDSSIETLTASSSSSESLTYSSAFVYGDFLTPTSSVPSQTSGLVTTTTTEEPTPTSTATSWNDGIDYLLTAFPEAAAVAQPNLGISGYTTGYIICLEDGTKIGVLSIPTFYMTDEDVALFSNTTAQFIQVAQAEKVSKVVIDLQQNLGGLSILALDTFKQFFPQIDPFGGSRLRSHRYADQIGTTLTPFGLTISADNESWYGAYLDDPFAATSFLNAASNEPFQDWPELFGPHFDHGDLFSTVQRNDLNNADFDQVATTEDSGDDEGPGLTPYGYADRPAATTAPFAAEDIVILVDGLCSSACTLFTEAMHHDAGVRMVAVGGQPQPGPMQGVAGSRGARSLDSASLDADIALVIFLNETLAAAFPNRDTGILLDSLSFNLQDQIRRNEYFPLQFAWEAADCRIFFTLNNFNNYTQLWIDAADALTSVAGGTSMQCVADSTGQTSPTTDQVGPTLDQKRAWRAAGRLSVSYDSLDLDHDFVFPFDIGALYDIVSPVITSSLGRIRGGSSRSAPRANSGGGGRNTGQAGFGGQFKANTQSGRGNAINSAKVAAPPRPSKRAEA